MPNNTHDRYVTWALQVPEGVAVPSLQPQWGVPVLFPSPDTFFPKNVVSMYAIRSSSTGVAYTIDGQQISTPAGVWFIYTDGSGYGMVDDAYFYGGTPDLSGGTQYPSNADRDLPVNPPQWVQEGTLPPWHDDPGDSPDTPDITNGPDTNNPSEDGSDNADQ